MEHVKIISALYLAEINHLKIINNTLKEKNDKMKLIQLRVSEQRKANPDKTAKDFDAELEEFNDLYTETYFLQTHGKEVAKSVKTYQDIITSLKIDVALTDEQELIVRSASDVVIDFFVFDEKTNTVTLSDSEEIAMVKDAIKEKSQEQKEKIFNSPIFNQ